MKAAIYQVVTLVFGFVYMFRWLKNQQSEMGEIYVVFGMLFVSVSALFSIVQDKEDKK